MSGRVDHASTAALLARCSFPAPLTPVTCGLSGGADSTALVALAVAAGCAVTAVHVDHGLRPDAAADAERAVALGRVLGVAVRVERVHVGDGPNLEERARDARRPVLGPRALLGHTADDRAETLLINLLRGAGPTGLTAMGPHPTRPILALRRAETHRLCAGLGLTPVTDPSNDDARFVRNRIRHEVLPLLRDVAARDVVPLLNRTADVVAAEAAALGQVVGPIPADDARALAVLPADLARQVLRRWLLDAGVRTDRGGLERVLGVARGQSRACQLDGGWRVERHRQRLHILRAGPVS